MEEVFLASAHSEAKIFQFFLHLPHLVDGLSERFCDCSDARSSTVGFECGKFNSGPVQGCITTTYLMQKFIYPHFLLFDHFQAFFVRSQAFFQDSGPCGRSFVHP